MRLLIVTITLLLSGCATAPKSSEWNWARIWNFSLLLEDRERAARLMERHDYIRYSEQALRLTVNKNLGSTPVFDVEREVIYFRLGVFYLNRLQDGDESARERLNVLARRLGELPNLHSMSKFLIARVQELNGGSYNPFYVPVPKGAAEWVFVVGAHDGNIPSVSFGDFKAEYERILEAKRAYGVGNLTSTVCMIAVVCHGAVQSEDELVVADLKATYRLQVRMQDGSYVQIGESSWLISQASQ